MLPPLSKYSLCALLQMDTSDKHTSKGGVTVAYELPKTAQPCLVNSRQHIHSYGHYRAPSPPDQHVFVLWEEPWETQKALQNNECLMNLFPASLNYNSFLHPDESKPFGFWRPRVRSFSSMIRQCTSRSHWLSHCEATLISLWLSLSFLSCKLFFVFLQRGWCQQTAMSPFYSSVRYL